MRRSQTRFSFSPFSCLIKFFGWFLCVCLAFGLSSLSGRGRAGQPVGSRRVEIRRRLGVLVVAIQISRAEGKQKEDHYFGRVSFFLISVCNHHPRTPSHVGRERGLQGCQTRDNLLDFQWTFVWERKRNAGLIVIWTAGSFNNGPLIRIVFWMSLEWNKKIWRKIEVRSRRQRRHVICQYGAIDSNFRVLPVPVVYISDDVKKWEKEILMKRKVTYNNERVGVEFFFVFLSDILWKWEPLSTWLSF